MRGIHGGGDWGEVGHEEVSCVPISLQRKCSSELSPPMSHWGHPWRRAAWGQQGPGDGGGSGGRPSLACVVEDGEGTSGLCPPAMDEQIWGTRGGSGGTLSSHSTLHCGMAAGTDPSSPDCVPLLHQEENLVTSHSFGAEPGRMFEVKPKVGAEAQHLPTLSLTAASHKPWSSSSDADPPGPS